MRPQIITGIVFGIINALINIGMTYSDPHPYLGLIYTTGILAFNVIFTVMWISKNNNYSITTTQGLKPALQAGMVQGILYFCSILLIQKVIKPGYFPELTETMQYLLMFNINIILFSFFSFIFGLIVAGLMSKNVNDVDK